jgi:hypothetical protein
MARLKSPKKKGDEFERELARYFNTFLFDGREVVTRAPLSGGGRSWGILKGGGSDLEGLPLFHVEAKRTERFNVHEAMTQAMRSILARGEKEAPLIINRRNRQLTGESYCTLRLDDLIALLRVVYSMKGWTRPSPTPGFAVAAPGSGAASLRPLNAASRQPALPADAPASSSHLEFDGNAVRPDRTEEAPSPDGGQAL